MLRSCLFLLIVLIRITNHHIWVDHTLFYSTLTLLLLLIVFIRIAYHHVWICDSLFDYDIEANKPGDVFISVQMEKRKRTRSFLLRILVRIADHHVRISDSFFNMSKAYLY